uniref:Uncharacterized protein n=1 Tax=Oryza barthii TaxID=65489 RepID=A0A0D3ET97_9ORYZ
MAMRGRGERRRWPTLLLVVLAFTVLGVVFDGSRVAGPHLHQLHRRDWGHLRLPLRLLAPFSTDEEGGEEAEARRARLTAVHADVRWNGSGGGCARAGAPALAATVGRTGAGAAAVRRTGSNAIDAEGALPGRAPCRAPDGRCRRAPRRRRCDSRWPGRCRATSPLFGSGHARRPCHGPTTRSIAPAVAASLRVAPEALEDRLRARRTPHAPPPPPDVYPPPRPIDDFRRGSRSADHSATSVGVKRAKV